MKLSVTSWSFPQCNLSESTGLSNLLGMSPSYSLFNSQVTRVFSEKFEIYLGGENLGNYTQKTPILSSENPFSTSFATISLLVI